MLTVDACKSALQTLLPQCDGQRTIVADHQPHGLDVAVVKLLLLRLGHFGSGGEIRVLQHIVDIELQRIAQGVANLSKHGFNLDLVAVSGAEIVDVAEGNTGIDQRVSVIGAKLAAFDHNVIVHRIQLTVQTPKIGITGADDDGVHVVLIVFHTRFDAQRGVNKGLAAGYTPDLQMLDRDLSELIENTPCRGGVNIVAEDDLADSIQQRLPIQIVQRCVELVGVGVFTVHDNDGPAAAFEEVVNALLGAVAGIVDLARILENIFVGFIQQGAEFFVVVENVAGFPITPVDVYLIGVTIFVGVVLSGGCLDACLCITVGHDKELFHIVPRKPGKQFFAIVDTVSDKAVDVDDVLVQLSVCLDDGDAIRLKLAQALLRDIFRERMQILEFMEHPVVQVTVVLLDGGAEHAEITDDPGVLVVLQLLEMLHFGRFVLHLKDPLGDTDQIGNLGYDDIHVVEMIFLGCDRCLLTGIRGKYSAIEVFCDSHDG